jgi:predicted DNA-binding transcriptional regulator AlpA
MATTLLTVEQAAERLNTTPAALWQARHQGRGPRGARFGKRVMYREQDIEAYIAERFAAEESGAA